MRVGVEEDRCCGSGQCVLLAPEVFDQREDDGTVVLLDAAPPEALHGDVRESAAVCPGAAIRVEEA
jgi:ferredoxin